ncbi:cysteine-rich receptor-like protein kinase 26 [Tanacetum coccineum]
MTARGRKGNEKLEYDVHLRYNANSIDVLLPFQILPHTTTQPELYSYRCGNPDNLSNYTENSTFKTNLDTTLSNFSATNNGFGFYNLSTGQGIDKVNALGLCRGDINPDLCQSCLNDSIIKVRKVCPNSIYVVGWYDDCSLTYSNDTLLGNNEIDILSYWKGSQTTKNLDKFNDDLRLLLEKLKADAATGGALRKFASGNTTGPDFLTIYAIMQCSPDLSKQDCISCLDNIMKYIPRQLNGSIRGRVHDPMCNFRYSERIFFNESIALVNPPPSSSLPSPPAGIY